MESFKNNWIPPTDGAVTYYFSTNRSVTYDAKELFTGITKKVINTSHFGEDDFEDKYTIVSPELVEQTITFKLTNGSMLVDKYSIECVSCPLTSWILEAANDSRTRNWECLDQRTQKIEPDKRYIFKVQNKQSFKFFRLKMLQPNSRNRWVMFLHYFNLHGNFNNTSV